jgi:hypothetical protein
MSFDGYGLKISSDGLTVVDGNPLVDVISGDVTVYARASTTLVGGTNQSQFELRVRHVLTGVPGSAMGVASGLNADGTQFAVSGQHTQASQDTLAVVVAKKKAVRLPGEQCKTDVVWPSSCVLRSVFSPVRRRICRRCVCWILARNL